MHTNFSFKEIDNLQFETKASYLILKIISVLASLWKRWVCTNMAQGVLVEYRAVNKPYICLPVYAWNYLLS